MRSRANQYETLASSCAIDSKEAKRLVPSQMLSDKPEPHDDASSCLYERNALLSSA